MIPSYRSPLTLLVLFFAAQQAFAESMATINDPDGYTNVRGEKNKIIARVRDGQKFLTWKPNHPSNQWEVILPDGTRGLMHRSRIRLLPNEPIMKLRFPSRFQEWQNAARDGGDEAEVDAQARAHGINYSQTLARAARGEVKAAAEFFSLSRVVDGAGAESHFNLMWELLHVVGDEKFAVFLSEQAETFRREIGRYLTSEETTWPISDGRSYLRRHFPKSFALVK